MAQQTLTPEVLWAQRSSSTDATKNFIYLTISIPDVPEKSLKLDIQPTSVEASGYSETKKVDYSVKLDLYGEIVPEETKKNHSARDIELVLRKKELKEEFWPRLLKEPGKVHFLRTDFDKWVDEDEQDGDVDDEDFMSKMGGMGGMPGMGGMGGMGGAGGFEGIDFSKLGAGPGGNFEGGADEEDEDDSVDDEDMPDLVGDKAEAEAGAEAGSKGKSKIEEVE